jgi:endoglucanase
MLKKLIAALLFVCPLVFANWEGVLKKPSVTEIDGKEFYEIATPENLAWFATNVNKGNLGYNAILTEDIVVCDDLESTESCEWTPIGVDENTDTLGFKGIFDGNGHKVSGIYIPAKKYGRSGFFGVMSAFSVVKNLTIENSSIQGLLKSYSQTGGLVGVFNGDSIINCEFHGTVKDSIVGGLVGWAERYEYTTNRRDAEHGHTGIIVNSRNYGTVTSLDYCGGIIGASEGIDILSSENFGKVTGSYCGGILGFSQNSYSTTIDSCINHATVSTTTTYGTSGGIVSEVYSGTPLTIRNTVNDGNVYSGRDSINGFVAGGFVGATDGKLVIENSVNNATVTRSSKHTQVGYAGGFIGHSAKGSVLISGSVNRGFVDGKRYSGGFVGFGAGGGKILNSINEGNLGGEPNTITYNGGFIALAKDYSWTLDGLLNKGNVAGLYAGGIISYATGPVIISNTVNEGNIEPNVNLNGNTVYMGGLVGYAYAKSKTRHYVKNVVNRGNLLPRGLRSTVYVGGIIGDDADSLLTIDNASNYGNIDIVLDSVGNSASVYAGGIVGYGSKELNVSRGTNSGKIRLVNNSKGKVNAYMGGISGFSSTATITESLNLGEVYAKPETPSSLTLIAGIASYASSVKKSVNEGRVELVGNEELSSASVAGIAYSGFVSNCINKGNLIHRWALKDSSIAAIQAGNSKGSGNYSIADTVMINGKMVAAVKGCSFADRSKLGIDDASNSNALTTVEMQNTEFAWRMNACNGTVANGGGWTQYGKGYPVWADDVHHPIYKLTFLDSAKVLSVKTYTVGSSYTDDSGRIVDMPEPPNPEDAGEDDLEFGYWSAKGKVVSAKSIVNADDSLYAFFVEKGTEPALISFVVDGNRIADYVLTGASLTLTLPDAPKAGRTLLGWYNDETLVGAAGASKKFTTAMTLTAKYESLYYTIQFLDQGTVLQRDTLEYGELPVFKGNEPSHDDYTFVGWTPEVSTVTGDASYFATYFDPNASSSSEESSSSMLSSSSAVSSSSIKSSSSEKPLSSAAHGEDWVVDALGGMGNFDSTWSTKGWTLLPTSASTGNTKLVENDDGNVVLQFWSNSGNTKLYAIQAKYPVYLQKGHSYKIKGSGYLYDDVTWDTVYVGLMQNAEPYNVFYEHVFSLNGKFESDVYNHCDNSQSGAFYINGGKRLGGFAIENVYVEEREIQCPGTVYASQIGFQKDGFKELVVEYGSGDPIKFVDESGKVALTVPLSELSDYVPSGQWLNLADFSELTTEGSYTVLQGSDTIYRNLVVGEKTYEELLKASLKFFYYQRASMELTEEYAGSYARAAGHPDTAVHIHSSSGDEGVIASPKGWYDAGDYGKYTVNAGITTYTLLSLYEHFPKYFKALKWNIPADGNLPDLLAEIKYNLDWMLTMQAKDGGVYHKLSGLDFPSTVMPAKDDSGARYIIGKSVTATYDFAGVMAAAARVYKDYNASYASKCLAAAESAFRWAENHPGSLYLANPKSVKTGAYEDSDASDEAQFAATELYVSTGNPAYKKEGSSGNVPSWQNVYGLATYAKSIYKVDFGTGAYTDLIATADRMVQYASKGFGVPMQSSDFVWGSNSVAANQGVWLLQAYYLTGKKEYYNTAVRALDYLVGKNPLGMSYVTGIGTNSPQNPHHRISQADRIKAPVPGMLVGGPQNKDNSDVGSSCSYSRTYPATAYYDNSCSYATNEVAINWNAPLAYLAGALEALATGEAPTFAEIPVYTGSSSSVTSSSSVVQSSSSQVKSSSSVAPSSSSVTSSSSVATSSSSQAKSSSSVAPSSSSVKSSSSVAPSSSSQAKSSSSVAPSSSSVKSSSSVAPSSSSEAKSSSSVASSSSSSAKQDASSSSKGTDVVWNAVRPAFNLAVNGMTLTLTNTQGGVVRIFDALGHLVAAKPLAGTTTSITLQTPGNYIVRVNGMSQSVTLK